MPYPTISEATQPYGPQVTFRTLDVLPPSALYVSRDDDLILAVRNPTVNVSLNLSIRFLSPQGEVIPELYTFSNNANAASVTERKFDHPEGFILSASVFGNNSARGQCFVKVFIRRGEGTQDSTLGHLLIQGYIAQDDFLGFPQSPTESSISGRGVLRNIVIAAPGPGIEVSQVVPAGRRWVLRSFLVFFGTSAAAGNRLPQLRISDPSANAAVSIPAFAVIAPSNSGSFNWAPGNSAAAVNNNQSMGMPEELTLSPGWSFGTLTSGLGVADGYTAPLAIVEEWVGQ